MHINTGRQTADMTNPLSSNRHSIGMSSKIVKTIKIVIDAHHSFTILVPEKLTPPDDDAASSIAFGSQDNLPTCGWLMEQV